jgi:flagellar hook-basal body complex protein FliE
MSFAMNAIAEVAANVSASGATIGSSSLPSLSSLPGLPGSGLSVSASTRPPAGAEATPFSDLLTDAVNQVSGLESRAHAAVDGLVTGTGVDVHQAMIAAEKASMAFELALAVRNKAVQAYQSVMAMQF